GAERFGPAADLEHVPYPVVGVGPSPVAAADRGGQFGDDVAAFAGACGAERLAGRRQDCAVDSADEVVEREGCDVGADGPVPGGGAGGARCGVPLDADVGETEGAEPFGPAAGASVGV